MYIDWRSFCPKDTLFQLENFRGTICHDTKGGSKFKRKLTFGWKNDIRNLVNFHASSWKSENIHFDWIHLSKAYTYLDEKVQKSYVSWHWRVTESLKENCFCHWILNASSGKSENLHFGVLLLPISHIVSS